MKHLLIIALIFIAGLDGLVLAQAKTGTTVGQFLKIEPSARVAAMGNAGSVLSGEASLVYFNPASLGNLLGIDMQFTVNQWLAGISHNYGVVAMTLDDIGSFAFVLTTLNSGEMDVRTVELPRGTGERYTVSNLAIGIAYARKLTDRVSVGTQLTYINETIWHSTLYGFAMNFGVQYMLNSEGAMLAASLSNFGTQNSYSGRDLYLDYDFNKAKYGDNDQLPAELRTDLFALPTMFRGGVSYPVKFNEDYKLTVAIEAIHPNDNNESLNLGGELNLINLFAVRAGYRNLFLENSEGGLSLGGGIYTTLPGYLLRFDYGWNDYGRLAQTHRLTLGIVFN